MMNQFRNLGQMGSRLSLFGGINLIVLSIAIFIYPQIVAYAIAVILMVAGLGLVSVGRRLKKRSGNNIYSEGKTYFYTK